MVPIDRRNLARERFASALRALDANDAHRAVTLTALAFAQLTKETRDGASPRSNALFAGPLRRGGAR